MIKSNNPILKFHIFILVLYLILPYVGFSETEKSTLEQKEKDKMKGGKTLEIQPITYQAFRGYAEIQGVGAGEFNPELWEKNSLNWVAEYRHPLIPPRLAGNCRNIYAPSAVKLENGWRLFYGAWDGVDTGNDRIYSVFTRNFLDFDNWEIAIEHGVFQHVCNVNALHTKDHGYEIFCTVYPDELGLNKPAFFSSKDGKSWNQSPAPYSAKMSDIVKIKGYDKYPKESDLNGGNVILREEDKIRLYFHNFRDGGKVFRATSPDGVNFNYDGVALNAKYAWLVNDVKKFESNGRDYYLMGLHQNGPALWYSLSKDGLEFSEEQKLFRHKDSNDTFIVALGWVVDDNKVLGTLYGAGDFEGLYRNKIFARWLQKRIEIKDKSGQIHNPAGSLGPERVLFKIPSNGKLEGTLILYSEDGITKLAETGVSFENGWIYLINEK